MSDLAIMFDEATTKANGNKFVLFTELQKITAQLTHTTNVTMYDVLEMYADWNQAVAA